MIGLPKSCMLNFFFYFTCLSTVIVCCQNTGDLQSILSLNAACVETDEARKLLLLTLLHLRRGCVTLLYDQKHKTTHSSCNIMIKYLFLLKI